MKTKSQTISLFIMLVFSFMTIQPASAKPLESGVTFTVNSTLDEPNPDPTLGKCISFPSKVCTLRAAIQQANYHAGADTIIVPAGIYTLKRPGYDDASLIGDLDIAHDITIRGAGSGATIIDGNGSVTHDRVFKILSSATNVTMKGITIRNGQSFSSTAGTIGGGGLLIEGAGNLNLSDLIFDGNKAMNGGGLFANFTALGGSMYMNNVIVHKNAVTEGGVGAGGGVFISMPSGVSRVTIQNTKVYGNTADGTGGGLFVEGADLAQWSIQHSEIFSNTAASAGGIGNVAPLVLTDSNIHNNSVTFDGGGIEAFSPMVILRTTIDSNNADRFGGGIFSLPQGSSAFYNDFIYIDQSTLSSNWAQYGGGIYHDGFINYPSVLTLVNSTLSGNGVFRPAGNTGEADGGGINIYQGQAQIYNTTVTYNQVLLSFKISNSYPGYGGGLYITGPSNFTAVNSIIAKNWRGNGIVVATPDDCYSSNTTGMLAYDLIQTTTNCSISGPQGGIIAGQDPLLGPLQNNGGPTLTQALLPGSPAIDASAPAGCIDQNNNLLATDQRSYPRVAGAACDIGAYEDVPLTTITLKSISTQDGWVLETSENGNKGGTMDNGSTTFRLGDDKTKKQYRGVLSFATGALLPDNAVISQVTLKMKKQGVTGGGNPVTALQGFMLDVKKGTIGTSALQTTDFQTAATHSYGPFLTALVGGFYTIDLTGGAGDVNTLGTGSGLTQIRVRFKKDDDNNTKANYLSLYSGNVAASAPVLSIQYYIP